MKRRIPVLLFIAATILTLGQAAMAAPSIAEAIEPDVYVVRDETGAWGGTGAGMTHQRGPDYWAKKVLDLSRVPEDYWKAAVACDSRCSSPYATTPGTIWPGQRLDEAFEIVVNGKVHRVATIPACPCIASAERPSNRSLAI